LDFLQISLHILLIYRPSLSSSRDRDGKIIIFWGIIAIINKRKIKIVLKKIGNGQINFWSVIPAWKTSHYRDIKLFHTMEGDPELD
jgi:hypothetical protein